MCHIEDLQSHALAAIGWIAMKFCTNMQTWDYLYLLWWFPDLHVAPSTGQNVELSRTLLLVYSLILCSVLITLKMILLSL